VDCEKFDKVALEMLYDELDELTQAAATRHMDHCSRCGSVGARLRATREVGALPMLAPPPGLEESILRLERQARQALPIRQRLGRGISVLAGYAMRPQLAMASLLLLMIGSSFLFLRAKPGDADSVLVTERGIREVDESVAIVPLAEEPEPETERVSAPAAALEAKAPIARAAASAASPPTGDAPNDNAENADPDEATDSDAYEKAMRAYRQGDYAKARTDFEAIAAAGGERAASAQLYAAHSARSSTGCAEAAPKFDSVFQKFPGTSVGQEAAWQAAGCYRMLGQLDLARKHYRRLLDAPAYTDRAQHALARLDQQQAAAVASRKVAAERTSKSKPAAAPRPAKPASKKPTSSSSTKSGL
jgi:TolA-binding protein